MRNITFEDIDGTEIELPAKYEVCGRCRGEGNIPLPGMAFTAEDFAEDPGFAEDYFGGFYDRECPDCHGLRVVAVVDHDRADPAAVAKYEAWCADIAASQRVADAEQRMGA